MGRSIPYGAGAVSATIPEYGGGERTARQTGAATGRTEHHHGRCREVLTVLGGAGASWPLAAEAEKSDKLPTIGVLGGATPAAESQRVAALVERLGELGWIEGRTVAI